jgi:hypothetical protein
MPVSPPDFSIRRALPSVDLFVSAFARRQKSTQD